VVVVRVRGWQRTGEARMNSPFRDLFSGLMGPRRELVGAVTPRRTFEDVVLPQQTYRALNQALAQIRHHDLIFHQWGLGERHQAGLGLAFNFAGPPGTGKTICAEAIANELGKRLLVVRYSELESMWVGETGKNVAAVFRLAKEQDAVLLFDEADAIASRRFTSVNQGNQREMNTVVNVLLRELDEFAGVVIFATNLASNLDPAFERRIRTHILFERPGLTEREMIWRVQLHPKKTPVASDVDFRVLADRFETTGGDIKNAVVKAAQIAADEPGPDAAKKLHQRHLIAAMEEVLAAKRVMEQSLFTDSPLAESAESLLDRSGRYDALEENLSELATRLVTVEDDERAIATMVEKLREQLALTGERIESLEHRQRELVTSSSETSAALASLTVQTRRVNVLLWLGVAAVILAAAAIVIALVA
jgi:SpoVK/Ycf46/Vps4 family AAA+-type ATPase